MTRFMISRFEKKRGERSPEYMHSNERDKIMKGNQNSSQNPIIISDSSSESESSEDSDFDEWIDDESDTDSITSYETNEGDKGTERGDDGNVENVDFEELSRMRNYSVQKLRTSWERIIRQYGNKRGQIESQNENIISQKANIEAIPAIGRSWTPAHSVVPPLTRFQGSAGFMIAPEWQILPSSEDGEEGISEDEEDDEDVIDFEANDWEKKLQNTSYFVERAERSSGIRDGKSKGKRVGNESSICSELAPELPLHKRQRIENEQTYENTNSPEILNDEVQHYMPVSNKDAVLQRSPDKDDQPENIALKPSSLKHSHQKGVAQTHSYQRNVAQRNDHQMEVVQKNDRQKDIALQQSLIRRDVRKATVRQYSFSKDEQQKENHRSITSSPKRHEKKQQQPQQKIITNFMTSSKPNLQMSSTFSSQCKGRNQCTKSFCLICGSVSGLATGLPI